MAQVSKQIAAIAGEARVYFGDQSVEQANGRRVDWVYRITCPDGYRVQLHGTPSVRSWKKEVYDELCRHGWLEAKDAWEKAKEAERQKRLEEDRKKNEAKLASALKRSRQVAAVSQAAGPYAPQIAEPSWIFSKHIVPETRRLVINPELAQQIMEKTNYNNRPLRKGRMTYWANIMKKGKWRYTHQGIAFDTTGALQDGQHRLAAAVDLGFTLDLNVSVGMPPENFGAIDVGAARSASDTLAVMDKPNADALAGAVRLIALYDKWGPEMRLGTRTRIPNDEFAELTEKYGERLLHVVEQAIEIHKRKGRPPMSRNALAAGIYLISRSLRENDPRVAEFIRGYIEGLDNSGVLRPGDSRLALREYLFNLQSSLARRRQVPTVDMLGIFIKAWNDWAVGNRRDQLAFRQNELFPRPFVPPPLED